MSDYIYMLESHLSAGQNRAVAEVQAAAAQAGLNLFLTGGAMRDMLAGFRIRDLDFVTEGNALAVAGKVSSQSGVTLVSTDEARKSAGLVFPGGVTAQIGMARREKAARNGGKPQISPATIQEDLRGRDFTCNAIALSLNKASRGLLLDPLNGLADIERHELRAASLYAFSDDPSRLLRLIRFRVRLDFTVEERTRMQVDNAIAAGVERSIPACRLGEELKQIALEDRPSEILKLLAEGGLVGLFSPALAGPKLNLAGMAKLEKAAHLLPDDTNRAARLGPFLCALTEKLTAKERTALAKAVELSKADVSHWQKLQERSKKLETALRSPRLRKPSQVYQLLAAAQPDEALLLLYQSALKPVQERLRNHFQKYLPAVSEIPPEEWATVEGDPGTPRHQKARAALIARLLDTRPPKPPEPPEAPATPEPPAAPTQGSGWRTQPTAAARGPKSW